MYSLYTLKRIKDFELSLGNPEHRDDTSPCYYSNLRNKPKLEVISYIPDTKLVFSNVDGNIVVSEY